MAKKGNGADALPEGKARETGPETNPQMATAGEDATENAARETASGASGEAPAGGQSRRGDEEIPQRMAAMRARLRGHFGLAVMAMMELPRYRHQSIADLGQLVMEPLLRNRMAFAHAGRKEDAEQDAVQDIAGMAIWASVSEDVDARIREQIRAGVFPVRLRPQDWTSGEINWLLDVIAPDRKVIAAVISSFRQVASGRELRLHPLVAGMLDAETLERLGMKKASAPDLEKNRDGQ